MGGKPVLSICIPAYNRGDRLKQNLTSILSVNSDELEVVVVDNVSTENLEEICAGFQDPRISYYRNDEPVVAQTNWFRSIRLAKGQWAMLLMDRDLINGKGIPELIEELRRNSAFGAGRVFCDFFGRTDDMYSQTPQIKSVEKFRAREIDTLFIANTFSHPSGNLYNKELLTFSEAHENTIQRSPRLYENIYLMYATVWDHGTFVIQADMLCTPLANYLKTHKSGSIASLPKSAVKTNYYFFTPCGLTSYIREHLEEMLKLDLSVAEKEELCERFYNEYVTTSFKRILSWPKSSFVWRRYDEKYKRRTTKEREKIAAELCENYKESVKLLLGDGAKDVLAKITPIQVDWWTYTKTKLYIILTSNRTITTLYLKMKHLLLR